MSKKGSLVIISGFSGAGKGTVVKELMKNYECYALSISATTRNPRPGEENGREYFFKTKEEFEELIRQDALYEYAQYVDNYYGTPKAYVEEQHMLEKKDRVIVGVSGGADSVCLLFVLTKLRDERQKSGDGTLEITAVHVHHGLRGDSADADERYVRKICDAWNVPLVVYHKNIRELAKCWNV